MQPPSRIKHRSKAAIALTDQALEILLSVVEQENTVSPSQHMALRYMLGSMARQAVGLDTRRYAYSLPCGGGKTQGAIALIVAAWELELGLTFAVATSQVEALCDFKRQLVGHKIPEQAVGLWHSLRVDAAKAEARSGYASLPATPEDDDRPILLLSHEKIRRGNAVTYGGKPRSLLIWDESLVATQARAVPVSDIQAASTLAKQYAPALVPYLAKAAAAATAELDTQRADPERLPQVLADVLSPGELTALRAALDDVRGSGDYIRAMRATTEDLLYLLERHVSVVETGSGKAGDGVLRYDVLVSPELANIAILDASHTIRLLTRADPSIVDRTSPEMRAYRRYDNVTLRLVDLPTGNRRMSAGPEASVPAAREIVAAIAAAPADDSVLIFTYKGSRDHLRRNLEKIGVDLSQQITVNGSEQRARIQFLTWGQETSRNNMRHCRLVIMAGVLRRDALDLAASLTAQQQRAQPQRNGRTLIGEVTTAEMAHGALQALHRGACRVSDADGQAGRTDVLILSADAPALRAVLEEALPGARWATSEPVGHQAESKTNKAADAILAYLEGLADSIGKVSTRTLKNAVGGLGLGADAFATATDRAILSGVLKGIRWHREGRSLVRNMV